MDDLLLIVLLAAVVVVGVIVMFHPIRAAERRKHKDLSAIRACCIVGWFLWPAWVVALVWAYTGPDNSAQKNAARAFPVIQKRGPRKFRVDGVDRQTRLETTMYVDAASEANARAKAELDGVLVTGCTEA